MSVMWLLAVMLAQAAPQARSVPPREETSVRVRDEAPKLPVSIDVRSELGKRFRFVEAVVMLDGFELTRITAPAGQELASTFRAFDGPLGLGKHDITVSLVYQGRNTGPFTYLDDYRYRVESSGEFNVENGRTAAIEVRAFERQGATVPIEQKPVLEIKSAPVAASAPVRRSRPTLILE